MQLSLFLSGLPISIRADFPVLDNVGLVSSLVDTVWVSIMRIPQINYTSRGHGFLMAFFLFLILCGSKYRSFLAAWTEQI